MKTIITFITSITLLLISSNILQAQTPLPYFSGFDNASQKNGWKIFRKGENGTYNWLYTSVAPYSGDSALYHDYPVGGTAVTDDWFVSPGFQITSGGFLDSIRHAFSGFGTPSDADTLALYILEGNADPSVATSKKLLHDFRGTNYNNDNTWRLTSNIPLPASASLCYFAIRYKTINNWLTVKFDNVRIRGNATTAIKPIDAASSLFQLAPNPAKDVLYIKTEENIATITIADMSGRIVYNKPFSQIVSFSNMKEGMYLLTATTASGKSIKRTFIKG